MNRVMSGLFKLPNSSLVLVAFGRAVKNKFSISRFGTDEKKMYCVFSQRRLYSTGPKDDENVTKLPVETGPKDDDLKNNGVPNAQTAIEFKRARQQKEYRKFENLSRDDLLVYIGKLESDLLTVEQEKNALETALGYRDMEDDMERLIFPSFFHVTRLSRFQKLLLTLTLGLTDYAVFLRSQILEGGLALYEYALAIDQFYAKASDHYAHPRFHPKKPKTEEEWQKIFTILGAKHFFEQKSLMLLFTTFPKISHRKRENVYYVLFGNAMNVQSTNIETALKSLSHIVQVTTVTVVRDVAGTPSGYVLSEIHSKNNDVAEEIHNALKSLKISKPRLFIHVYSSSDFSEEVV